MAAPVSDRVRLNRLLGYTEEDEEKEKLDKSLSGAKQSDGQRLDELLGITPKEELPPPVQEELPPPTSLTPSPRQQERDLEYHEAEEPYPRHDDELRFHFSRALETKLPKRDPNYSPVTTKDTWSRWWINTEDRINAANRVRNAQTPEEKEEGVKDYIEALSRFRSDTDLMENIKTLQNPKMWGDEKRREYNTRQNAIAVTEAEDEAFKWATGQGVTPIPEDRELLDQFNKRNKTDFESLDEAMRFIKEGKAEAEKEAEKASKEEKIYSAAHAGTSFLSWPHHLESVGKATGAALGEASAIISGRDKGKYAEAYFEGRGYGLDEDTLEDRLRGKGVSDIGVGLATVGQMAPDIAAAVIATPATAAYLRAMRVPAQTVSAIKGPVSFGATLTGKTYGLTEGNVKETISSGLMGMAIPPVHQKLSDGAGRLLLDIYKKSPQLKGTGKVVEELTGLAGIMALTETHALGEWLSADSQEEKDRLLGEFLGRAIGFAIPAPIMAKGRKDPVGPEAFKTPEAKQRQRELNLAVERIKADPAAMKALENALNKNWDAFKTIPKPDVGAAIKARQEKALSNMSEKARSAFERVEKKMSGEKEKELDWDLYDLPVTQLRNIAKELGIKGMGKKPVDAVIEAIKDHRLKVRVEGALREGKIEAEPEAGSEAAYYEKPTDPVVESLREEAVPVEEIPVQPEGPPTPPPEPPSTPMFEVPVGPKKERAFTKRAIKFMEERGEKERAQEMREDPDSLYEELRSNEVKKILQSMNSDEFADLYRGQEGAEKIGPAIEIENIRRLEAEGKQDIVDSKFKEIAKKLTLYGQWIQQATHFGVKNDNIIKMIDSKLESRGYEPLTEAQKSEVNNALTKTKAAEKRRDNAENEWLKNPTLENELKMVRETFSAQRRASQQATIIHRFNPRAWSDIAVTGIQGNLLSPASFVLNAGANILVRPLRATARGAQSFLDPALDLVFQVDRRGNIMRGKALLGKSKGLRDPQLPTPFKSLKRTLKGFKEGMGFRKLMKAMDEQYDAYSLLKRGKSSKGLFSVRKPSVLSERDWRNAKNAMEMLREGATENPYEAEGSALAPANARLALKNFIKALDGDMARSKSALGRFNDMAKLLFEGTVGWFPDVAFRFLYAGDIGFRRAAEHRIIGRLAERKLKEDNVPKEEWPSRVDKAIERPDLFFNAKELKWVEEKSAAEVYQQENLTTRLTGSAMGSLKDVAWGAPHFVARVIVPYQKTPINITGEILSYTPLLGLANIGLKGYNASFLMQKNPLPHSKLSRTEGRTREAVHDFNEAVSKWATGLGVSHLGSILYANNLIQPSLAPYQEEPRRVRLGMTKALPAGHLNFSGLKRWAPIWVEAMRAEGDERLRLKRAAYDAGRWREGDIASDLLRIGPTGAIIMAGVDAEEAMSRLPKEKRSKIEKLATRGISSLTTTAQFMLSQTYTRTPSELIAWVSGDPKVDAASFLSKLAETGTAVGIPRTSSWFGMINEKYRPTYSNDPLLDQVNNKIQARLDSVGLKWIKLGKHRDELPVIRDFRGEKILRNPEGDKYVAGMKTGPTLWNLFGISKTRQTSPIEDPAVAEMQRLYLDLKDPKGGPLSTIFPNPVLPILTLGREHGKNAGTYDLTPKQYEELQELVGAETFKGRSYARPRKGQELWANGIDRMMDSSQYWNDMSDEGKAKLFSINYKLGKASGVSRFVKKYTDNSGWINLKRVPSEVGRNRP